jgi:DNA-binding FadR family transcriptional regulator
MALVPNERQLLESIVPRFSTSGNKRASGVADAIREDILDRNLGVGHPIGAEVDLMRQFGASRSTLREAIRQLEAHGVARTRRGGNGGLFVARTAEQFSIQAMATYFEIIDVSVDELFEALEALETRAAILAAEHGDFAQAEHLRQLMDELNASDPETGSVAIHMRIRELIGTMSDNPALAAFNAAIYRSIVESIAGELSLAEYNFEQDFQVARATKQAVVERVIARDAAGAENAMRTDIALRKKSVTAGFASLHESEAREGLLPEQQKSPVGEGYSPKLAQTVATRLAHRLVHGDFEFGDHLGTEPDLVAQFGVSRAIFREAIRILELHGLLFTRRGNRGGLLVGQASPAYTLRVAGGYLRHLGLARVHLDELRGTIAIAVASLAAERRTASDQDMLRKMLRHQHECESGELIEAAAMIQIFVADISGNRALALFLRVIMAAIWPSLPPELPAEVIEKLNDSHRNLVEAIIAGDPALARRFMVDHVRLAHPWSTLR